MKPFRLITVILSIAVLSGCAKGPLSIIEETGPKRLDATSTYLDLISLPPPIEKIVVGVYKFRDQTGQFKSQANATSFSTAVTQGGTSMLIKALSDSGWFIPIEREGLANLLEERKIIRATRMQHAMETGFEAQNLPPLLFSSVLLEGGIIAYDTNIVTGGLGVEYFGAGGSGEIRRDQVTIYLRAVSVVNGQVLSSVATTKTILSRRVGFGLFRFVSFQRLLEAEVGFSTNEPPQIAVLQAIERAVVDMIVEGVRKNLWSLANPDDINSEVMQRYIMEQERVYLVEGKDMRAYPDASRMNAQQNQQDQRHSPTQPYQPQTFEQSLDLGTQEAPALEIAPSDSDSLLNMLLNLESEDE